MQSYTVGEQPLLHYNPFLGFWLFCLQFAPERPLVQLKFDPLV
jgi:hypothetical protein